MRVGGVSPVSTRPGRSATVPPAATRPLPRSTPITHQTPTLSLVIPAYNQRERTVAGAHEAAAYLSDTFDDDFELIVVDDGSDAPQVIRTEDLPPGTSLHRHPRNFGKGGAIRTGVLNAHAPYVIFTDSDLPFSLDPIPTTLAWLQDGADVVIGDRELPESKCETQVTFMRRLSSFAFTFMVRRVVGLDFLDTQCGYKGYRTEVARRLYLLLGIQSFAFDVEILARAVRAGCSIRRQPLSLVHNEDSSVRLQRHAPQMLADMLVIAWRLRRGEYDE
jgi:dolichyl-phosphate beta-glucosyltransferase